MNEGIEKLVIAKEVFGNSYNDFIQTVSSNQDEIHSISTSPINNYINSIITKKDRELLDYVYQNIKYYFDVNKMYTPKISEGMAAFVSKGIVLYNNDIANLSRYFSRGNYNADRELANPFEEISRLLVYSLVSDSNQIIQKDAADTLRKLHSEDKAILYGLNLAVTKNAISNKMNMYAHLDTYVNLCDDLEMSNIDSDHTISATTKDSRGVILTQIDRIIDIYHAKLDFEQMVTGYPSASISNKLKMRFDDKIVLAKRTIGVYEKTKQLVIKPRY